MQYCHVLSFPWGNLVALPSAFRDKDWVLQPSASRSLGPAQGQPVRAFKFW